MITQDVLEHLLEPTAALREICRTLRPGGTHLFTVPWYYWQETKVRARKTPDGIEYLDPPDYHGDPAKGQGFLVVTEWGRDLCDTIYMSSGMTTTPLWMRDRRLGIEAEFIEVFISRKPNHETKGLLNRWTRT